MTNMQLHSWGATSWTNIVQLKCLPYCQDKIILDAYFHEPLAFQSVKLWSGIMKSFPLGIQDGIHDLPPRATIQDKSQAHYAYKGYQNSVHGHVRLIHIRDCQQSDPSDDAAQNKEEDNKGREATRLLPFFFTLEKLTSEKHISIVYRKQHTTTAIFIIPEEPRRT